MVFGSSGRMWVVCRGEAIPNTMSGLEAKAKVKATVRARSRKRLRNRKSMRDEILMVVVLDFWCGYGGIRFCSAYSVARRGLTLTSGA